MVFPAIPCKEYLTHLKLNTHYKVIYIKSHIKNLRFIIALRKVLNIAYNTKPFICIQMFLFFLFQFAHPIELFFIYLLHVYITHIGTKS